MKIPFAASLILLSAFSVASAQKAPELSLPIACRLGKDCFIQQYVDIRPGPEAQDYRCGGATYDGHTGTDFRVLSVEAAEAGVPVLAAAPGRVKGLRDGMEDRLVAAPADKDAIAGRECGNGVTLDHGGGWETQYCHMRHGSVTVRRGQSVAAGEMLGLVGYSGEAQFPHVHLDLRKDGERIDPFLGGPVEGVCLTGEELPAGTLWSAAARDQLAYRDGVILDAGFADAPVSPAEAEMGRVAPPTEQSPALVFYARMMNARAGDVLRLTISGPEGFRHGNEAAPIPRHQARYVAFAGKKRRAPSWPAGLYQGKAEVVREGSVISTMEADLRLP